MGPVVGGVGTDALGSVRAARTEQAQANSEWTQQEKLVAADGREGDLFGESVAVSSDGTTTVIGASGDDDPGGGSAYVFGRDGGAWSQQTKLTADDGDDDDGFGFSAAVSSDGTTALIGARGDEDPNGFNAGSAYVFGRDGEAWSQQAKLVAADGDDLDEFAFSVAVSSDGTAVVGARGDEDPNGDLGGSAYVFSRDGEAWSQQAKLVADDGDDRDEFAFSVAVSSDGATALIGANGDEDPNGFNAGSAYVFGRDGEAWSQQAKLVADDGDESDGFGGSVAVSNDGTAVVGASGDEDPNGLNAGSAYVFGRDGGAWSQRAKLVADDADEGDLFGFSMAVSSDGTAAVVGARNDGDPNDSRDLAGSAYVFRRDGEVWSQHAKLVADDGDDDDLFGFSVAVSDGGTAVVGASGDEDPNGFNAGSAYVFRSGDGSDGDSSLVPYANSEGIVDTGGLRGAIGDWRAGEIGTGLLREVIDAWRSGEPVD